MRNIRIFLKHIFYGTLIGASVIIPGLSGGTTAIILGVYGTVLYQCSNIVKNPKNSILSLFPYFIGGIIGLLVVSYPLEFILRHYSFGFSYFIIGIILGSVFVFKPQKKMPHLKTMFLFLCGAAPVLLQCALMKKSYINTENALFIIIIGVISAIALILPGISLTNILIFFNVYDKLLNAINTFDLKFCLLFCLSMIFGLILSIKIITEFYERYTDNINCALLGMVVASVYQIFQGFPNSNNMFNCLLMLFVGFFISWFFGCKK